MTRCARGISATSHPRSRWRRSLVWLDCDSVSPPGALPPRHAIVILANVDWSKVIAAGVGPIIVISACGLLCLAFYNRLAAVVTRLRSFHREQLQEQEILARLRRGAA